MSFGGLLGGAILTETTFNLNGVGGLIMIAIRNTDYWVLNAVVFCITLTFVMVNLGADLIYGLIDPRIRY